MAVDADCEFIFIGEKNGTISIWNLAKEKEEKDDLKQTIEVNTDLHALSFEGKYFGVISLATEKGLVIRDIKKNSNIYVFSHLSNDLQTKDENVKRPKNACISLAWDSTSIFYR